MSKWLIIHADGFGLDEISTRTILSLVKNQLITSTSIAANSVNRDELETISNLLPAGTGIHLNLIAGKAVCEPAHLPGLVDENGNFLGFRGLIKNFLGGKLKPITIWEEISAQINRLARAGINISHADSGQHLHQVPVFGRLILEALRDHGIEKVRNCKPVPIHSGRDRTLAFFSAITRKHLHSFITTQGTFSYPFQDIPPSAGEFERIIQILFKKHVMLEMRINPHLMSDDTGIITKAEMDEILEKAGIQKISYRQL